MSLLFFLLQCKRQRCENVPTSSSFIFLFVVQHTLQRWQQWQQHVQTYCHHLLFCYSEAMWKGQQCESFLASFLFFFCCNSTHNVKRKTMTMIRSSTLSLFISLLQHSYTKSLTTWEYSHVIIFLYCNSMQSTKRRTRRTMHLNVLSSTIVLL